MWRKTLTVNPLAPAWTTKWNRGSDHCIRKSLPFFYFLTFEKGKLPYIHPVGQSVGRLVDVTINFFNIYRHKSPLSTQYHSIPISTKLFWPSTIKYQPVLPCKDPVLSYIMMSIATMSIDHNSNKRFALFTWSSFFNQTFTSFSSTRQKVLQMCPSLTKLLPIFNEQRIS